MDYKEILDEFGDRLVLGLIAWLLEDLKEEFNLTDEEIESIRRSNF